MAKRRGYSGLYIRADQRAIARNSTSLSAIICKWDQFADLVKSYLTAMYTILIGNYVAIGTIFVVAVLSFLLPDITHRYQASQELNDMKKVLDKMSAKVKQAEVACLTVADKICCLRCSMHDDSTETSKELRDLSICTSHCIRATLSEPAQIEKEVGLFRRIFFPKKNTSLKEVTIMSYVYTDSFDAKKPVNISSQ